ncbi:MAG: (deoxy)nucleoside triphosphate pyrophosphohydrolase [Marmoricola sp.]
MTVVVGVAIVREGRLLAARRTDGGWEFPGGKVEPGETPEGAAVREIDEELGCGVEVTGWLEPEVEVRAGLVLRVATARLTRGEPMPLPGEHDAIRWLRASELDQVDWLPADRPFVAVLGTL